jgi:hypothetical protein
MYSINKYRILGNGHFYIAPSKTYCTNRSQSWAQVIKSLSLRYVLGLVLVSWWTASLGIREVVSYCDFLSLISLSLSPPSHTHSLVLSLLSLRIGMPHLPAHYICIGGAVVSPKRSVIKQQMLAESTFPCMDDSIISTIFSIGGNVICRLISSTNKFDICSF